MSFKTEKDFEDALIAKLTSPENKWDEEILENKTEEELIKNWAKILHQNNNQSERLGEYELTNTEMQQIIDQINELRTPAKLNGFINGTTITIKRDNPKDKAHLGKEISLKIYDRNEIAGGSSKYQIARQPKFKNSSGHGNRGDITLLINGMPLIHIELKRSGEPIQHAIDDIQHYSDAKVFQNSLFSLVQIFVCMTPEDTIYFANPGPEGKFNKDYFFHWADFNNIPITSWEKIASSILSIPMAHQLIGFYTIADEGDQILKVMRSYQYYAVKEILDKVFLKYSRGWKFDKNNRGGYIWHTTGSGKTMTSFKAAQLIANSQQADKVVFLTDRIELGTQSFIQYTNFADDKETINDTKNSTELKKKLKSDNPNDTLIVTSVQKMNEIKPNSRNKEEINLINSKRIVFIVDECHRSHFGKMNKEIKNNFPNAIFFGFSGTPIQKENQKFLSTTADVFGDELHRYSIVDGIRDKNVLGFDPYYVETFKNESIKKAVALDQANTANLDDLYNEEEKDAERKKIFYHFYNEVPMAGDFDKSGQYIKGIEDYLDDSQYRPKLLEDGTIKRTHQNNVVKDILDNWIILSHNGKFHAIFATSSIKEACEYYKLLKEETERKSEEAKRQNKENSSFKKLKISCLFDSSYDATKDDENFSKDEAMYEILEDYNNNFGTNFTLPLWKAFKKDISLRLAHKKPYLQKEYERIDILIVVNQMLTGYDSKWINTLYL
ncbi:HsdR family type I site-specific deoxyribonuclease, partial [Metamycoplasma hyosynoviae]|uniref:HsdR family type I site-specific deoxyribonuclease n=1 Tax=Metamycoplasma hyosynoviae TaxID=29559 RepID=UPI0023651EE3